MHVIYREVARATFDLTDVTPAQAAALSQIFQAEALALAFGATGPDGTPWAVKARNPGSKEDLSAVNAQRYVYVTAGQSTPAHVVSIPAKEEGQGLRFLIVEGELNALACWVMLEAAGRDVAHLKADRRAHGWEVQGVASAVALPHLAHIPEGADVYVYADPDEEGQKARQTWAALLASQGAQVFQLGETLQGVAYPFWDGKGQEYPPTDDACDCLSPDRVDEFSTPETHAAFQGHKLLSALEEAKPWTPPRASEDRDGPPPADLPDWLEAGDVPLSKRTAYGIRDGKLCALTHKEENGEEWTQVETLADFTARIVSEVVEEDGSGEPRRVFHIEGFRPDGAPLFPPVVEVPTGEFTGMNWAVSKWGGAARLPAGNGKKDKARDALQVLSNAAGYPFQTVYLHTGWIKHPEHGHVYLSAGAVIGAGGAVDGVSVNLPGRLSAYALPDPAKKEGGAARDVDEVRQAVRASLDLLALAPDAVGVPLLGAAYRSILGAADFVVWVVGETGKHKTAFTGLLMSHFGPRWGRKFLPDGWNSSANALEVNAFRVKDALFVVDDFKPAGGAAERAKLDGVASRIIQGAADGAGRGTLTTDRKSRAGLWPRGTVATSAEDLPRGHSNRARLVVVEVHTPLIHSPSMSEAYYSGEEKASSGVYALALAGFVQAVAGVHDALTVGAPGHARRVRELSPYFQGAHGRTGDAAAEIAYGWECFLSFAGQVGAVTEEETLSLWTRVVRALKETAQEQGAHLSEADPVARSVGILSELLAQGAVYLADKDTGSQPDSLDALACGWQVYRFKGEDGEEEGYKTRPGAALVGYHAVDRGKAWAYFLPDALHEQLQRVARGQGGASLPDPSKLWANMRDRLHSGGFMKCQEEKGRAPRPAVKIKGPDGVTRQLIALEFPLDAVYQYLGNLGNLGNYEGERPTETVTAQFPVFNSISYSLGNLGNYGKDGLSFPPSPPSTLEDLPGIEDPEVWAVEV